MAENQLQTKTFSLKGRLYTLTVISILDNNHENFVRQISQTVKKAPLMFKHTPVVIDCSEIDCPDIELSFFIDTLKANGFIPVGVHKCNQSIETLAINEGLAVLGGSIQYDRPIAERKEINNTQKTPVNNNNIKTKIITTPVRSGQQVISKGDLIITSHVSHGSELLADGNIHVYGALRGRALAGINGDKGARIFCQHLEAELVAVAGYYRLSDAIGDINNPCQIYLKDEQIQIKLL